MFKTIENYYAKSIRRFGPCKAKTQHIVSVFLETHSVVFCPLGGVLIEGYSD
jgi:hypothetical protein